MYTEVLSPPPQKRIRDCSSRIVNENHCNLFLTPINETDREKQFGKCYNFRNLV